MNLTTETTGNAVHTGHLRATLVAMKARLATSLVYVSGARPAPGEVPEETLRELVARAADARPDASRGGGAPARRAPLHEPRDRVGARNQCQDRRAPRRPHPAQARRGEPARGR